ncbi:ExeM/NucH family extracellular endonuclease [Kocuria rosea]|uniref:ExeM/NucH family extracellular endonuclease n=1 Tax=Kocuria rosea TaxID=1275 RepID=UPI00203DEFA5|nr:ExeM/NucH family extracellular endonuclease [Kocuria rosea]
MNKLFSLPLSGALAAALLAAPLTVPVHAAPDGANVVINEAYTNGGSANAVYTHKFVELYNPTVQPVDLTGWTLQYRSASGTGTVTSTVALSGTIAPGGYFLVQCGSNAGSGAALPAPDLATSFNPAGVSGTIVLSDGEQPLAAPTGSVTGTDGLVDLLGYGTSNTYETAPATGPSANADPKSMTRADGVDTDDNSADFTATTAVTPQNSGGSGGEPAPEPVPEPSPEPAAPPVELAIRDIQGTGDVSPRAGQAVTTRGVVTAVYATGGLNGWYLQTPGTGGDLDTAAHDASDGVFVYSPSAVANVELGQYVEVTGTVAEYHGQTQISVHPEGVTVLDEAAETVKPATVAWPADETEREDLEGMLLDPAGEFVITDNYALNGYGEIGLAAGTTPLVQPTAVGAPGSPEAAAQAADNEARGVLLDDGATTNYGNFANASVPLPYLSPTTPMRIGAPVDFVAPVVLGYSFEEWRLQPTTRVTGDNAQDAPVVAENTRTAAPEDVGGDVQLATFNVLNYFTTTGDELTGCTYYTDRAGDPVSVRGGCDARGAAEQEDLERQQAKIVAAINALDAEVVSLEEIENSAKFGKDRDQALSDLVEALNTAAGSEVWAYVPSPAERPAVEDEDVIRTAFIYQPAALETVGESVILDDEENFDNAREPLAQTFRPAGGDAGGDFTVVVNHFKSKGSAPSTGPNADAGDGAGAWNADRTAQAQALVAFAERLESTQGTDRVLLAGDFNSYDQEDPMRVLHEAGYTDLAPAGEHSYAYGGMVGSLDHVLASPAAAGTVTGSDIWEINAHESVGLEYSRHNHNVVDLYAADPYRASDHNPEIVGLAPAGAEPAGPQKPGRGNSGEHPGKGLREHADDRAREVLHRRLG